MKFIKLSILIFSFSIIFYSCSTLGEAGKVLRNEKIKTTDEFLIKKKEPLTQPPDFEKIPEPGSSTATKESEQKSVKKILKSSQSEPTSSRGKSSSTEDSILKRIKK
tara:strand:- start:417 stop:737 length:321 start_codon:yes stop_codon:yes gene_type:complete